MSIWDYDRVHDVSMELIGADELWDKQCFGTPSDDITEKIISKLKKAKEELDELIEDLQAEVELGA